MTASAAHSSRTASTSALNPAGYYRYVSPQAYDIVESLNFVVMNVIGDMTSLAGALICTAFLVVLPELLRGYVELQHILYGVVLIVVMAFLPGGLAELGQRVRALLARRLRTAR